LCFPKVPSTEKELREKWCFPAHLNSHGHVKGKGVNHLGHIYIYTVGVGMMMPGQLPKNNHILLTNLLPFLLRKITTMPYLPAW
jgi:hypothetical protein